MKAKFRIILLSLIVIFTLGVSLSFADDSSSSESGTYHDGYDEGYEQGFKDGRDKAQARTPVVRLQNPKDVPTANPGEVLEITITYKNESDYPAKNLIITPTIENDSVLVYERPLSYKKMDGLKARKEESTTFKIKVNENAKKGTYPIKIKFEYTNSINESFSREDTAYYEILTEKSKPILTVSNIKFNKNNFKYGDKFYLTFDISNIGNDEAKDVEVNITGFENNSIMPQSSQDYTYVGTINGKGTDKGNVISQAYPLEISPNIVVHDVTLTVHVKYKGFDDKEYTLEKNVYVTGIEIKEKESGEKKKEEEKEKVLAKPKLIISSYGVSPNNITAGDEFTFSFTIKNTSNDIDVRNIKISLSSKEGCFIITKGSNTFYIERLNRGNSVYKQIDLKAKQDLTSNSYEVHVDFDYEDYDGKEYQASETVNIPVTEYSKLVINSVNIDGGYVNNPANLSFEYVNMGKAVVSNITATVRGDFEPVQEQNYIGNLQAGNSDYFDIEVKPTHEGLNNGILVLTYEDSSGKQIEVTKAFETTAFEEEFNSDDNPGEFSEVDFPVENERTNYPGWQISIAGLGTFLLTFFVTKFIVKKIALKKFENDI